MGGLQMCQELREKGDISREVYRTVSQDVLRNSLRGPLRHDVVHTTQSHANSPWRSRVQG